MRAHAFTLQVRDEDFGVKEPPTHAQPGQVLQDASLLEGRAWPLTDGRRKRTGYANI